MFIIVWAGFYIAGILVIHDGGIVVLNRISAPVLSTITPLPLCSQQLYSHFIVRGAGCLVFSNSVYPTRVKISIANAPISALELQPGNYGCCMGENKRLDMKSIQSSVPKDTSWSQTSYKQMLIFIDLLISSQVDISWPNWTKCVFLTPLNCLTLSTIHATYKYKYALQIILCL